MLHHDSELLSRNEGPYCVAPRQRIRKFVFCTQDEGVGFVADSCADVLRVANRLLRKDRFSWAQTMGLSGLNEFLKIRPAGLAVILVGGADNPWRVAEKDLTSLRPKLQSATHVGIVGAGIFPLRKSGCHNDKTLAVHPNFRLAISEIAAHAKLSSRQVTHAPGISAATGTVAAFRMMVELVGQQEGAFTEHGLREHLGMDQLRSGFSSREHWRLVRKSKGNPVIGKALAVMSENLEDPLPTRKIAEIIDMSPRQLERSCARHLGLSPLQVYRSLRLDRARQLLTQTSLPISEIAVACGFSSTTGLSKWYRDANGESPGHARRRAFLGEN